MKQKINTKLAQKISENPQRFFKLYFLFIYYPITQSLIISIQNIELRTKLKNVNICSIYL